MLNLNKMKFFFKIILISLLIIPKANAITATDWLKTEIDDILNAYKNENISNIQRFEYIENTINQNS